MGLVQGFKAASGVEGRTYWSRPDVARAHGATSWPLRSAPKGTLAAKKAFDAKEQGAADPPEDSDSEPLAMQDLEKLNDVHVIIMDYPLPGFARCDGRAAHPRPSASTACRVYPLL